MTILIIMMVLICIGTLLFAIFKAKIKGTVGEWAVAAQAKRYLHDPAYMLMHDLTLPDGQGGTTQIDHVLLSPFGIFVIETKNYQGWIFAGAYQKHWTQQRYKKRYQFQNPLHQNYKHLKVLEELLSDLAPANVLHSIVVFMPAAEFKTPMPKQVFKGAAWTDYVKDFKQPVLRDLQLKRIQLCLEKHALPKSWATNRQHRQYVMNIQHEKSP